MVLNAMVQQTAPVSESDNRALGWCDPKSNINWVFGMRWLPALGSSGQKALQRNLRQQGLVWAVGHGKFVRLIGVPSSVQGLELSRQSASAAAAFAAAHPSGEHALCLQVSGVGLWLVASSQGCVISDTDRWVDTTEQAEVLLDKLNERHTQLQCQRLWWSWATEDADQEQPEFLQASLFKQSRFERLPSSDAWRLRLVLGVLICAAIGLVLNGSLSEQGIEQSVVHAEVSPTHMSARAYVHHRTSLQALLQGWYALPVDPQGWLLQGVSCRIEQDNGFCKASYKRRTPDADNEGLARHQTQGWVFEPESLDRAFLTRRIKLTIKPFEPHLIVDHSFGLTQLQRLSARVATLALGSEKSPHQVMPVSQDSVIGPEDQSITTQALRLSSRPLSIRLALRQADRINELNLPLRWHQADLAVVHGAQIDKLHGYLMLSLQGEWLETN